MKAIVKTGEGLGFSYMDIERPKPKAGEVLIEVAAAAICGTDIHYYHWNDAAKNFASKFNVKFPFVVGHECAGTVAELGEGVSEVAIGDRVSLETHIPCGHCYQCQNDAPHNCQTVGAYGTSCDGCFAEFAIAPAKVCFKLSDAVTFEKGALFEPTGVAMYAVESAQLMPGDTVLVIGCGAIGLLGIQTALLCGASRVIAADVDPYKVELAKKLGAAAVNSARDDLGAVVREHTARRGGVDVILEMSGSPKVYETMFDYLRLEGRVVTVGHPGSNVSINITRDINLKGASIKGNFGRRIWETWWKFSALIDSGRLDPLEVVTHRFKFEQADEAFKQVDKGAGKILFVR